MGISVSGGNHVRAALGKVGPAVRRELAAAVRTEADDIRANEQSNVPVASGDLQAGIDVRQTGDLSAEVGVYDPELIYAVWIEWGRSSAPAQPFATPAAEQARARWPSRAATAVKKGAEG